MEFYGNLSCTSKAFSASFFQPLGAADYLALSENFDVIILRNIPKMTVFQKTEARRFITLIDALYDNRVRVRLLDFTT